MATTTRPPDAPDRTPAGRRRGIYVALALSVALVVAAAITLRSSDDRAGPPAADHGHGGNRSGAGQLITGAPAHPVPGTAVRTVATGLGEPSSLAFRPDGTALVAERRTGRVLAVRPDGQVTEVHRVADLAADGGAGLLGVTVAPAPDGRVYLLHTTAADTRVVRIRADGAAEPVLTGIPRGEARNGGAIVFGPDGMLYVATGDAGRPADPDSLAGKVLRLTPDGAAAPGNPIPDSTVYARGLRDPQGLAWYGQTDLFLTDSGANPAGAADRHDELNLVQANGDYGWPAATGFTSSPKVVSPVAAWRPGEAGFGGLTVVGARVYLAGTKVYRIWLEGTEPQTLLDASAFGRFRAAATAPDGALWLASATALIRVAPDAL
jgi:glucose/arabinose dehydrogenase